MHDLAARTMRKVHRFFLRDTKHRPSPEMYAALEDIASTLAAMAKGEAAPKVYLSSLDPGVGKTTVVRCFIDTLLEWPEDAHVGVLICVARLAEISHLVDRIGIPDDMFAVFTADAELNKLGKAAPQSAQALFTTQQMVERRLQGGRFKDCEAFHYRGKSRAVRVWDETWLPGQGLSVSRYVMSGLLQLLVRGGLHSLADTMEDVFTQVRALEDGDRVELPDFAQHADLNELLGLVDLPRDNAEKNYQQRQREELAAMWYLSGKMVSIRKDGKDGQAMLTYRETLPEDLAPLLVLDASGRVRHTYQEMEKGRRNIERLRSAVKRYDRLRVHVWNTGGGKGSFVKGEKSAQELINGIASTVNSKPNEEWLVIHHTPNRRTVDVVESVRGLLVGNKERVHFLNWGRHMATNEYQHVRNVVLAGTLFYRPSQYEALGRLAAGMHPVEGTYPEDSFKRIADGESRHGILQALCRASVRGCDGDQAHECNAYIIASVRTGIPSALPDLFPGCQVVQWRPVKRALVGKVKEAIDYLESRFAAGERFVKFTDTQKALGMEKKNFKHRVRRSPDFAEALAEMGAVEWGPKRLFTGFRLLQASDFGFVDETTTKRAA